MDPRWCSVPCGVFLVHGAYEGLRCPRCAPMLEALGADVATLATGLPARDNDLAGSRYLGDLPACGQCRRQMTWYGGGRMPCSCSSGLCDDCCCGWDQRCSDCGSTDHDTLDFGCPERGSPTRDRAHRAYLVECARRLAAVIARELAPSAPVGP